MVKRKKVFRKKGIADDVCVCGHLRSDHGDRMTEGEILLYGTEMCLFVNCNCEKFKKR